jgi:hypothetical protein
LTLPATSFAVPFTLSVVLEFINVNSTARRRAKGDTSANAIRRKNAFASRRHSGGPRSSLVRYLKNTGLLVCPGVRLDFPDFLD